MNAMVCNECTNSSSQQRGSTTRLSQHREIAGSSHVALRIKAFRFLFTNMAFSILQGFDTWGFYTYLGCESTFPFLNLLKIVLNIK